MVSIFMEGCKTWWMVFLARKYLLDHRHVLKNESMFKWINYPPTNWSTQNFFIPDRWEMEGIFLWSFGQVLGANSHLVVVLEGQYFIDNIPFKKNWSNGQVYKSSTCKLMLSEFFSQSHVLHLFQKKLETSISLTQSWCHSFKICDVNCKINNTTNNIYVS